MDPDKALEMLLDCFTAEARKQGHQSRDEAIEIMARLTEWLEADGFMPAVADGDTTHQGHPTYIIGVRT